MLPIRFLFILLSSFLSNCLVLVDSYSNTSFDNNNDRDASNERERNDRGSSDACLAAGSEAPLWLRGSKQQQPPRAHVRHYEIWKTREHQPKYRYHLQH